VTEDARNREERSEWGEGESLRCWACPARLSLAAIRRDGYLKSREERLGGPFVLAECPSCRRKLRLERNAAGRHLVSPADDFSALDGLLQFFDADLRKRYWEEKAWRAQHEDRRRVFFSEERAPAARGGDESGPEAARAKEARSGADSERGPQPSAPEGVRRALDVIGAGAGDPWSEVSRAFRRQCKLCHPDRFALHDEAYRTVAARRFAALKEAYDVLRRDWKPFRERAS